MISTTSSRFKVLEEGIQENFVRFASRRANGKDFSLELSIYNRKIILITSCHFICQIYTFTIVLKVI